MNIKEISISKIMLRKETRDIFFGILMALLFGFLLVQSFSIKRPATYGIAATTVGADFFPKLFCTAGCLLAIALSIQNWIKLKKKASAPGASEVIEEVHSSDDEDSGMSAEEILAALEGQEKLTAKIEFRKHMVIFCIIWAFIYVFLIGVLGMIVASALYLFVQVMTLSTKEKRTKIKHIILVALFSIVIPLAIYAPFRYIFGIMLPMGIFR